MCSKSEGGEELCEGGEVGTEVYELSSAGEIVGVVEVVSDVEGSHS